MTHTPNPNHILVTGGCGFIGANLVPLLEYRGYTVRVLDNLSAGSTGYLGGSSADIRVSDIRDRVAVGAALAANLPGFNVFHLASGREVSVAELARLMCETAGKPDHPIEQREKRAGEVERNFAACDLARQSLGFAPNRNLEDALAQTWRWMQSTASATPRASV